MAFTRRALGMVAGMGLGALTFSRNRYSHTGNSPFPLSRAAQAETPSDASAAASSPAAADQELKRLKQEIYGLILPKDQWTDPYMNPDCEICAYLMKIPCGEIYKDYMETIMRTNHNFTGTEEQFEMIQNDLALDKLHAFYECNDLPETKQWWIDNKDRLDAENKQEERERYAKINAYKKTKVQEEVRKQLELKKMELSLKNNIDFVARQELRAEILKLEWMDDDLDHEIAEILDFDRSDTGAAATSGAQASAADSAGVQVFKKAGVAPKPAVKEQEKVAAVEKTETVQRVADPSSAGSRVLKSVARS